MHSCLTCDKSPIFNENFKTSCGISSFKKSILLSSKPLQASWLSSHSSD